MRDRGGEAGGPFWTDGDMLLRVQGTGREADRIVKVRRPFAIVGQDPGCDVVIADRAVSDRHAYLHLDLRGLYVVDLVTRTGTRIEGAGQMVGWIPPGRGVEVAGHRIELLRMRIDGRVAEPPPCDDDMLVDQGESSLIGLTLDPERSAEDPWVLGSELVFLGGSSACGIPIKGTTVARVHCAVVRTASGAFVVDLCGHHTWVDDRPVRGALELLDGSILTVGPARFTARVEPVADVEAAASPDHLPVRADNRPEGEIAPRPSSQAGSLETASRADAVLMPTVEAMPAESTQALLAWMMGAIQGGQGEALRQQGEFQLAMTQLIRQIQQDNAALLGAHLSRIESIDRELAALRSELVHRNGETAAAQASLPAPPPPPVPPLKIKRPDPGQPPPVDSKASTTWLLERVSQLENENRSAWRDLLGRLSSTPKR